MDALLRESKKEKLTYKLEAVKCLGEVLQKFCVDKFSEVFSILSPVLVKVSSARLVGQSYQCFCLELFVKISDASNINIITVYLVIYHSHHHHRP